MSPLLLLALVGPAQAEPAFWGKLPQGPHAVGFRSEWQLDHSRRYNTTFTDGTTYAKGKAPRPILVNLWYPAVKSGGKPMPHRDYLAIGSQDDRLGPFAKALAAYNRGVIAKELLDKDLKELSERESRLFQEFLDTPTACRRDAPAAKGRFPLVVYHAGAGSSYEDNAAFCEFLASHGFVVAGSAFQSAGGKSLNIDGGDGSAGDIEFLISHARTLPNADWQHVGLIGHSAGAQASLSYLARGSTPIDALVSLDTTQDYYGLTDTSWKSMTDKVTANRSNMTGPVLMAANPHAFFEMADSLPSARRYYLTIKALGHNDFIAQGVLSNEMLHKLKGADAKPAAELEAIRAGYEALCVYVLRFFEAELKGLAGSKEYLATRYRETPLGGRLPHVEFAGEKSIGADAYHEEKGRPPTPRQVRPFYSKEGARKTIALLRRFRKEYPDHPVYHHVFAFALVGQLVDQKKLDDARAFHDFYREGGRDAAAFMVARGEMFLRFKSKDRAAGWFMQALQLDPKHARAAAKLKELAGPDTKR